VQWVVKIPDGKFAFWAPRFWKTGERYAAPTDTSMNVVCIENDAAAELVPVSTEAAQAVANHFMSWLEHQQSGKRASSMLDMCDGAVLMHQVGWLVERRLRNKLWEARLEGRYDGEVELESLVAFYSGVLDVCTEKEMHALGCDVPRCSLQDIQQQRGFLKLPWWNCEMADCKET